MVCCRHRCSTRAKNDDGVSVYKLKNATCSVTSQYPFFHFSIGSGFFIKINDKYYVITCAHIIEDNPEKVYIDVQNVNKIQNNHKQIRCSIIGVDKAADIAVLRPLTLEESPEDGCDLQNHPYLRFGNSSKTKIGQKCFIIGNALGLDPFTIADGIVRDNKYVLDLAIESMLISAPTWSGNSGSPILDICGRVIGMVCYSIREFDTEHSTLTGGATQFMMEKIINKIIQNNTNYTTKGYMGIPFFTPVTDFILMALRQDFPDFLQGNNDILKGLLIVDVEHPAINATIPLESLDIITKIRYPISGEEFCLGNLDYQYHPSRITWFKEMGDKIELHVTRPTNNTTFVTTVTLASYPQAYDQTFSSAIGKTIDNKKKIEKRINGKTYEFTTLSSLKLKINKI
jgi:S1-C subfamily serine protease